MKKASISNHERNRSLRHSKKSYYEESSGESYVPRAVRQKKKQKYKGNAKILDRNVVEKDSKDKREIEKTLTGFELRKDKIKKIALEKILHKRFKEDSKNNQIKNEAERKRELDEKNKKEKNEEKRRKLKSNHPINLFSKTKQKCESSSTRHRS